MIAKILLLIGFVGIGSAKDMMYDTRPHLNAIRSNIIAFNYYNPFFNQSVQLLQTLSKSTKINSKCRVSLKRWIEGLEQKEKWSLKCMNQFNK